MAHFIINGGRPLTGTVPINGSKNASVALLIGALINQDQTTLHNVPHIEEINRLSEVLQSLGVFVQRQGKTITIQPPAKLKLDQLDIQAAQKTRSIILAIGALSGRYKNFSIPQAGGCRLGSRTVKPHLYALENFGLKIITRSKRYLVSRGKLRPAEFVLYESGDTVTENALLAAAQIPGKTVIKMASANYMVQELCLFLQKLGIKIDGLGTTTLTVYGRKNIKRRINYTISQDPIEAMMFLSIAATTHSAITLRGCPIEFLELELLKLSKMGFNYHLLKKYTAANGYTQLVDIKTKPSKLTALEEKIHALPFPGLNQDNLPFFVPIATQAKGKTLIHDWTYENRAIYFSELNKLGAKITLIDNHRVIIQGPTRLKAAEIICPPALRPAAIILVAMLGAKGRSILRNVYPIHRGYENLEKRLTDLGAQIELVK